MRGSVTKKGNKWYIVVYLGNEDGKRKYQWFSGYDTKREAEHDLPKKLSELQAGIMPSKDSLNAFFERWVDYKHGQVRPRTVEIYQRTWRLHIKDSIGKRVLYDITPPDIVRFYRELSDKQLSNRYISQIHTLLHDVFDRAVKWSLIQRNATDAVDAPKPERKKFSVWTLNDATRFLAAAEVKEHRFYIAFLIALTTGMRQGEILGLQWKDIDWDHNCLYVRRNLGRVNGEYTFGPPKSESGERTISLPDSVMEALRQHKAKQSSIRLRMGTLYHNLDLIVTRLNGNVVSQSFLRKHFTQLIEKVGMPYIRFHDLRHTHASILLELGEKTKVLQERLGHSDYSTTMDIYTHVSKQLQDSTARLLQEGLFGK